MKLHSILGLALAGVALALPAAAIPVTYVASLSGAAESPPNASPGTGTALVIVDGTANTMHIEVTFAGLVAGDTASHIHCCTTLPGVSTAGVATVTPTFTGFPGGVTSGTYIHDFDMTLAGSYNPAFVTAHGGTPLLAFADLLTGMAAGKSYLNIHSSTFGGGEIRGFLAPIPEPQTYALMLAGLAAVGAMSRRRRMP